MGYALGFKYVDCLHVFSLVNATLGNLVRLVQAALDVVFETAQVVQTDIPDVSPYVPTGQAVQAGEPAGAYVPKAIHLEQVADEVAPMAGELVPAEQEVHPVDAVDPLYFPMGQDVHGKPEE